MSLNFLSGLLLATVTVAIVLFVVRELLSDGGAGDREAPQSLSRFFARFSGGQAKPVNEHLIGAVGKVISNSGDSARPMRVEIGRESWFARLNSAEKDPLPVDATVTVLEIDGAVLVVAASNDSAGVPSTS